MQLADSMRLKASNKISAGVMGNARENSGSFSAGIRFKSNQYLLQSRRANIQNSLSYLEVQRNSIMEARDIMEKIAMTKIKFDAPTLNASDRRNLNIEFMELTGQLKELKNEKFNGVSLFTSTATGSPHLFKGSKAIMDTANNLTVSDHVLHYYDIEKIIDAGDAVSRGKGGLDVINFETDPAQKQVENITIDGSMAAGDTFSFQLNTLNAIREVMDTQTISYQYSQVDEDNFGTDHSSARDHVIQQLITDVQSKVGTKIVAEVHPNPAYSMRLTALTEGDAFELFNVRASGSDGNGTQGSMGISSDSHEAPTINPAMTGALGVTGEANAAESRNIRLDFRENATGSGASIIAGTTTVGVTIDGTQITYTATPADVIAANATVNSGNGDDGSTAITTDSNPEGFDIAAQRMAEGLAAAINADGRNLARVINASGAVDATFANGGVTGSGGIYTMNIVSTERGKFINLSSDLDSSIKANPTPNDPSIISGDEVTSVAPTINFGTTATTASNSWVALENADPARTFQTGDRVTITMDEPATTTPPTPFDYDVGTHFTNWAGLKTAMGNDGFIVNDDPNDPNRIIIAAPLNATGEQPTLSIQQTQTHDVGSVLAIGTSDTLFTAKASNVSARDAANATGSGGNLKVDFNIANNGEITGESVNAGSTGNTDWRVGDQFTIGNNTLADDIGSQVTFRVDGVEGKLKSGLTAADFTISGTGKTAANTYNNVTTDAAKGLTIDITTDADGNITGATLINGGTGFADGDDGTIVTVAADQLGGDTGVKNAVAATFEITVVAGSGEVSAINHQGDGRGNTIEQYTGVATNPTSGGGSGLTLDITTDKGVVTGVSVNSAGSGYLSDGVLPNQVVRVLAANAGGGDASDIDFTINRDDLVGEVKAFSAQGNAKSSWSFTNANAPGGGTGLIFNGTANRSGAISLTNPSAANNGTNYTKNTPGAQAINLAVTLDGGAPIANVAKNIDYTSVESAWTNRVNDDGSADIHTTDDVSSNPAYDSANLAALTGDGNRGYQYIPDSDNIPAISVSDSLASAGSGNAVGEFRQVEVSVGTDSGAGEIAPGDIFTIVVQEQAHSDETSGTFAEPARGAYAPITLQYTAQAGDDATDVAQALHDLYNNTGTGLRDVAVAGGVDTKDLPTLDFQVAGTPGRVLVFSSHTQGEDFDVTADYISYKDELDGSGLADSTSNPGGLGDPNGNLSEIKNISTFRIPKSIEYFEEMLAQNEAEASRLMKAMEHLEDSMIHNEDALSKVQDTDYSQASVEHMRNAVKVQMANNVMGKSMRMNDLLIDLTTKHYRGSMLNAKA
jgi:hypothetical protein